MRICILSLVFQLMFGFIGNAIGQELVQSEELEKLSRQVAELNKKLEDLESKNEEETKDKEPADTDVRFYWKNGLKFESYDKKTFRGKLGGRLQFDLNFFVQDASTKAAVGEEAESGAEFRRARLYTSGEMNLGSPTAYYKFQLDFAGGDYKFADVYLGLKKVPYVGTIQIGQMYEPFSLEQLTSDNYITFLERSLPIEAFSPARNVGFLLRRGFFSELMTVSTGLFFDDPNDKADGVSFDGKSHFTARITGLPWSDESSDGSRYLHLGVGGSVINARDEMVRYRSRPETHQAPRYVDTGNINADWSYLMGAEAALILGPFSIQGEYMRTWVNALAGDDPSFYGYYVSASYLLTGEHRPYKKSSGSIDRVKPFENFSLSEGGPGAWELTTRFSYLDLNDRMISGGKLLDWTLGVNWYLNPNYRIMSNYVLADVDRNGTDGQTSIFEFRFQVDF